MTLSFKTDRAALKQSAALLLQALIAGCKAPKKEHISRPALQMDESEVDEAYLAVMDILHDPQTKYATVQVWLRHLHYTHNLDGDPPP